MVFFFGPSRLDRHFRVSGSRDLSFINPANSSDFDTSFTDHRGLPTRNSFSTGHYETYYAYAIETG